MECPACFFKYAVPLSTYTGPGYSFYLCRGCGVHFAWPMKAASKEWYEQHSHYCAVHSPKENKPFYEETFLKDRIRHGRNRLLAIGCGYNLFLKRLSEDGYDVTAIDFNENVIDFTRRACGITKAFACTVDDFISRTKDEFDIIIFFEVLEHLQEPGKFLRSLPGILSPEGYIVVSVPNRGRFFPQRHWADYPPHHLTRWDKGSISGNLLSSGFVLQKCVISAVDAEQLMYACNFYFWTEGRLKNSASREQAPVLLKIVLGILLKIRTVFYNAIAALIRGAFGHKGTFIYTVARRKI